MKAHILIVDDDLFMAKLLTFVLSDNGYQISMLPDPDAVPRFLDEHPVNLVLLDVAFPRADGLPLCAAIQRAHPDLPVVLRCARPRRVPLRRVGAPDADDYITEPFEPMELLLHLRTILDSGGGSGSGRGGEFSRPPPPRPSPHPPRAPSPPTEATP